MPRPKNMENEKLENVQLCFRNFQGREERYNPPGRRVFNVILDDAKAAELEAKGWHVKVLQPKTPDALPIPYLSVSVGYKVRPPKVTMVVGKKKVSLDEDSIAQLDFADIISCDMVIAPNETMMNGVRYIRAYLNTLWANVQEDPFADKYANERTEDSDVPW